MSGGEFVNVRPYIENKNGAQDIDETTDTYDTVDWLLENVPNHNGRVGISGISYPGFYTSMGAIDAHPAVKAVSPQAPVSKWMAGDDWYHNGAFLLSHAFNFYIRFGWPRPGPKSEPDPPFDYGTPDGYKFFLELGPVANAEAEYFKGEVPFWQKLVNHGQWDEFWAERDILQHLSGIKPAVLVVGGWYDSENLFGVLKTYYSIESKNPNGTNMIVMGPWSHGQWARDDGQKLGDIDFGSRTSDYYTEHIEAPFFNHYLKGEATPKLAEAMMFDTGAKEWRFLDSWPPQSREERKIYFGAGGKLSFEKPGTTGKGYDEYVSDPAKPVPYTAEIAHWYNPAYLLEDQRFVANRPDVLVYQTDSLQEDVTLAGPIWPSLYVSTSGTDSDWIVKVIDVYPDDTPDPAPNPTGVKLGGYQKLVRGDVLRGKFRNSLSDPVPFKSNEVTEVEFELQDVFHTFKKGHRIMVQIQNTWFPLIDRNPQKFVDIYQATEADFQKATQRVFHDREHPSHLRVEVMR
jgi:putative CocE/NonD family hydrolase